MLKATSSAQSGTLAPPSGVTLGAGGGAQLAPGAPARCPAETVSQPATGQVMPRSGGGTARVDSDAAPPWSTSFHRFGVRTLSRSLHSRPGTPITTTLAGSGLATAAPAVPAPKSPPESPERRRNAVISAVHTTQR